MTVYLQTFDSWRLGLYGCLLDFMKLPVCLLQAVDLDIDESSFTGETLPSRKHTHPQSVLKNEISQLKNVAFMGTFVCSGHGKVCVCVCGV